MPTLQSHHVRLDVEGEKDRVPDQEEKKEIQASDITGGITLLHIDRLWCGWGFWCPNSNPLYLLRGEKLPTLLSLLGLCHNIHRIYVLLILPYVYYLSQLQEAPFSTTHRTNLAT